MRMRGRVDEALPLHRQSVEVVLRLEGEKSPWLAVERYQLAADLIAALATLEKKSPPHQRLAEIQAASAKLR